jgi:demethylmacrocin O-methyltransferase
MKQSLVSRIKRRLLLSKGGRRQEDVDDLSALAIKYGSDKYNSHWYTPHYHAHFAALRMRRQNILEIGVGGYANGSYDNPHFGGASLRMWREYFPKSSICGIDVVDKRALQEDRITIFRGSQSDEAFLLDVCQQAGPFDIVIDDGSHVNRDVLKTFAVLFPLLKDDGIYSVEDTQTSYWPSNEQCGYGGDSENLNNSGTIIGFFKSLVDGLNHAEFVKPNYEPRYFDEHIVSLHFYHNLVVIYKGANNEGSNMVKDGQLIC